MSLFEYHVLSERKIVPAGCENSSVRYCSVFRSLACAVATMEYNAALTFEPFAVLLCIRFLRPMAKVLMAFSARLLSIGTVPFSRNVYRYGFFDRLKQAALAACSVYVSSPALSAILLRARPKRYSAVNDVNRRLTARYAASGGAPSRYDDPAEVVDASYYSCCFHILPPLIMDAVVLSAGNGGLLQRSESLWIQLLFSGVILRSMKISYEQCRITAYP